MRDVAEQKAEVTLSAVLIDADGTRHDLGIIATSEPEPEPEPDEED